MIVVVRALSLVFATILAVLQPIMSAYAEDIPTEPAYLYRAVVVRVVAGDTRCRHRKAMMRVRLQASERHAEQSFFGEPVDGGPLSPSPGGWIKKNTSEPDFAARRRRSRAGRHRPAR